MAFRRDRKLRFPLLPDFEVKGAVARLYGVYREDDVTSGGPMKGDANLGFELTGPKANL
jgi:hypothetical protein